MPVEIIKDVKNLKPCPFCGDTDIVIIEELTGGLYKRFFTECEKCGARSGNGDRQEVVERWNRRAGC